jgi:FMN phosphatase YigB (HAD superfamily)
VVRLEACLVDVYETLLSCDFAEIRGTLPKLAGVAPDAWREEYRQLIPALTVGELSKAEAFAQILLANGIEPRPDLLRELSDKDRELLVACSRLYDDAVPFLQALRSRGIKIAIVSNCSEHTHDMLDELGLRGRGGQAGRGDLPVRAGQARSERGGRRVRGRSGLLLRRRGESGSDRSAAGAG